MKRNQTTALWAALLLALPAALRAGDVPDAPIHIAFGEVRSSDIKTKGPVTVDGTVNADIEIFGASLTVRGTVNGDVAAMGGKVDLGGEVGGDVAAMGGGVSMTGTVTGDLVVIGGDLVMGSSATVKGDVTVIGGSLDRADGSVIKGDVSNIDSNLGGVIPMVSAKLQDHLGKFDIDIEGKYSDSWKGKRDERKRRRAEAREGRKHRTPFQRLLGMGVFLVATAGFGVVLMLLTMLVPKQVETVRNAIKEDFWRTAGAGFLVIAGFMPAVIFLTVSLVGIPLVPLAFVVLFIAVLLGISGFSLVLAERLFGAMKRSMPELILAVGSGFALLMGLMIVGKACTTLGGFFDPIGVIFILANLMLLATAVLLGLGAALTTRMGTQKHARRLAELYARPKKTGPAEPEDDDGVNGY